VAPRRDAVRNRATLTRAAAEVFREHGADAPLDLVARRAGLGRGTLYRHFPDRGALLVTLIEDRFETLDRFAATYPDDDLVERLLVEICGLLGDVPGLMGAVQGLPSAAERLSDVTDRTSALLGSALERAQRAGLVRSDVGLGHLLATFAMFDGAVLAGAQVPDTDFPRLALELTLRGLRPHLRADAAVPERRIPFPVPEMGIQDGAGG